MSAPTIHSGKGFIPASKLIEATAEALSQIKAEDGLTDPDIGAAVGKHHDQAAKYRTGLAEMSMVTFLRACERWNGRFANDALAMIGMKLVPLEGGESVDQVTVSSITKLLMKLSVALEDGVVDDRELAAMRDAVDGAIDGMRERLKVRAA